MDHIDEQAQTMFARCAAEGQAATQVASRHEAEALRAELRRLGREFDLHVRTIHRDDRVIVIRGDGMPWDDTDAHAAEAFSRIMGEEASADDAQGDSRR